MGILSNLAKNPSLIALAALGIGLFVFRDRISGFFSDITGGAKTANLLGENLLSNLQGTQNLLLGINKFFTDFKLPDFKLPEFEFPEFKFDFEFPDFFPKAEADVGTDIDKALAAGATVEDIQDIIGIDPTDPNQDPTKFLPPDLPTEIPTGTAPSIILPTQQDFNVQTTIPDQQFFGGGVSFEGGTVTETPIENLSLSQIIDKFMVTASQAANIKAQAIGFTPEEQAFLNQGQEISPLGDIASMPAVSQGFEGLTPEQIFAQLIGGNIQNF